MRNHIHEYLSIDYFRVVAAMLVVAIHTSPLTDFSGTADFILTRELGRVAVPFFFMASAFFLYRKATDGSLPYDRISRFVKKTALLYGAAILFYLPLNFYSGSAAEWSSPSAFVKDLLFDGTFYHLWYLPASILGALLCWQLLERLKPWQALSVTMFLYAIGLFGDSYYGITTQLSLIDSFYQQLFRFFDYTRNGFFFAPVFFVMGSILAVKPIKKRFVPVFSCFMVSLALMLAEGLLLHSMNLQRHDSMYLMLIPCMYYLFQSLLSLGSDRKPLNPNLPYYLRTISVILYLIHPAMIVVIRGFVKAIHMEQLLVQNSLVHYFMTALLSFGAAWLISFLLQYKRSRQAGVIITDGNEPHRAWIEVTLPNLLHNLEVLQSRLPEGCQAMPVIKANAYGHGSKEVAAFLEKSGINSFAVATAEEGIELRKAGVKGDILILGFTPAARAAELCRWRLIQTAVDASHAKELSDVLNNARSHRWHLFHHLSKRLPIHLKIDTGMHRLGEAYQNRTDIIEVFSLKNLKISGIYTHLCASDSPDASSVYFTQQQIQRFSELSEGLKAQGIPLPSTHVFSSYGAIHYGSGPNGSLSSIADRLSAPADSPSSTSLPNVRCHHDGLSTTSYARVGIALYGVLSTPALPTKSKDKNTPAAHRALSLDLKPVLSLKARIALVRTVDPEEGIGYGLDYTAHQETRIAVVSIGYADGYPRSLSGKGLALVHGTPVPIIGRICMDQLMIDVTGLTEAARGDIVTLIGRDGYEEITAEQTADAAGTITNELLSRLGSRLEKVYLSD
ncbi:acyltransferase family protein [Anoxybacterium hadale]|uniref:Acyltransferase family protein n=1 Tax=Anoxybacterium hadale TaxID=3408580 RepID=A0ACD1A8L9_9FIRM|nr:acyltransferase family protein [Clostridiales bacterium]